ncbi:GNAT family N-acetyltransferase [Mesoterricola sediminis]|uniref:N-acetyltransferase domain-containing protein n=1 Tax=Mesoterricola sediminis TaxID=2927980 RepID=A0AA48KDN7_9BACT|nr:GNAT family N-acetyltransferase [Mesoterricola sediminis]BDU76522.1 hypothetical protein METESE_14800 [Mesoterricola sediminis]
MDVAVRRAEAGEARELGLFAEACFREAFGYLFPEDALDLVCARAFAGPLMEELVRDAAWIAEGEGGWRGYAALAARPCPAPGLPGPQAELSRLYVTAPWQGRGVSGALMTAVLAEARRRGCRSVWLEAFEGNPRALRFYGRWGFHDLGGSIKDREGIHLPHRILGTVFSA